MAFTIDQYQDIINALTTRRDAVGAAARAAILGFVQQEAGAQVLASAKLKAPRLFGDLRQSGVEYPTEDGVRIAFGGPAAHYAARMHQDDTVSHSGARAYKWVYRGAGVTASARGGGLSNPGEWNAPTRPVDPAKLAAYRARIERWAAWATKRRASFYGGATGAELIEWSGDKWRFRKVGYTSRYPASRYPKVGQSHFLFGPNSAWEQERDWVMETMVARGMAAAGEAVA